MASRKFFSLVVMLGTAVVLPKAAVAQQKANTSDIRSLVQRLEAAEARIRQLEGQLQDQPTTDHLQAIDLQEIEGVVERVSALEKKVAKQDEVGPASEEESWIDVTGDKPTVKVHGRMYVDYQTIHQSTNNMNTLGDLGDGARFDAVWLRAEGEAFGTMFYRMQFDLAATPSPAFKDMYMGFKDLPYVGNIKVGHFKEPFSLEWYTSLNYITYMERSMAQALDPHRNVGIMIYDANDAQTMTWALGTFRGAANSPDNGRDVDFDEGNQAITGRLTFCPYYDEGSNGRYMLHLGSAYSYRESYDHDGDGQAGYGFNGRSFSQGPENNLFGTWVRTGDDLLDTHDFQLFNGQAGLVWGSFSLASEWTGAYVNGPGNADLFYHGAYASATYFLTGEHRPYDRKTGVWGRVKPLENFFLVPAGCGTCSGWGAWELKARLSYLDLDDPDDPGDALTGDINGLTLGVNWYLNPYMRVMLEYHHVNLDNRTTGNSTGDFFAMRSQVTF